MNRLVSDKPCCLRKCLSSTLTLEEVQGCRELFWEKTEEEQRVFILNHLYFSHRKEKDGKMSYSEYKINGKSVCQKAWLACYGISNGGEKPETDRLVSFSFFNFSLILSVLPDYLTYTFDRIEFSRFFNLKADFENGRTTAASLQMGRYVRSRRQLNAKTWFKKYVNTMADSMPHERKNICLRV